jgi:hypothetical protein
MSGRRLAPVVAVDRHENPALRDLASPIAEADALAEVLGDPDLGDFPRSGSGLPLSLSGQA